MKTDIYNFILRLEEKVKMNCRLVRLLSLSTLFMIPFAFGIVNAQTDAEAAAANSNSEVVINEFENVSEQDTASSFTENQNDSDVDLNSNQEVLLTEESKNSVQASYDEEDAVSETEKSVSLRVESINGILRITDNTGKFYKGMHTIGTKTYCADENARVIVDRFFIYNGRAYISDKTGAIRTGVVFSREYGYYYYCNPAEGGAIKPDAGFVEWNGNRYYVNKGGKIAANGFTIIHGTAYIIGKNGVIKTGVVYSSQYGYCYYCDPENGGAIKVDAGYVEWEGKQYYVNKGGKIVPTVEFKAAALMDEIGHSLFNAYKYLAKQPYYRMYVSTSKGKEWFADFGFSRGEGNCYVKTAMLYYMAKSMGYDNIRAVDGYCLGYGGERLPHGWLEYYENGKTYIIDPTFENEVGRNGYMIQYGQKGTWKYLPNESRTWTE